MKQLLDLIQQVTAASDGTLARIAGVSGPQYSHFKNGKANLSYDSSMRLLKTVFDGLNKKLYVYKLAKEVAGELKKNRISIEDILVMQKKKMANLTKQANIEDFKDANAGELAKAFSSKVLNYEELYPFFLALVAIFYSTDDEMSLKDRKAVIATLLAKTSTEAGRTYSVKRLMKSLGVASTAAITISAIPLLPFAGLLGIGSAVGYAIVGGGIGGSLVSLLKNKDSDEIIKFYKSELDKEIGIDGDLMSPVFAIALNISRIIKK